MKRVAIIGVGRLGTRLAEQLVMDEVCDEVLLDNRSPGRLAGTLLSLQIWASLRGSRTRVRQLDWDERHSIDLVAIAIKEHYDPRSILATDRLPVGIPVNLRHIGLPRDLPLVKEVCGRLQGFTKKVVVITNPVDIISSHVVKWLPNAQVTGFGVSVDAARLSYILSRELRSRISRYDCPLAGEHGGDLVALSSLWNHVKFEPLSNKHAYQKQVLEAERIGFTIVEELGYTVHDCAVVFAEDIAWLLGRSKRVLATVSVWDETACIGWPLALDRGRVRIVDKLGRSEKREIRQARDKIASYVRACKFLDQVSSSDHGLDVS